MINQLDFLILKIMRKMYIKVLSLFIVIVLNFKKCNERANFYEQPNMLDTFGLLRINL